MVGRTVICMPSLYPGCMQSIHFVPTVLFSTLASYYLAYIQALEDAFLAIDAKLTTEEVIKELAQIAGRPTEDEDEKEKVADEDDGERGIPCLRGNQHFKEFFFNIVSILREDDFLGTWGVLTLKNPMSSYTTFEVMKGESINLCT